MAPKLIIFSINLFQQPITNTTGYVPVNQFGRPIMNAIPPENTTDLNNIKVSMKTPIVASTDANGISG